MIYKKIVPHSKHTVFITKMDQLMLFNAIIDGYSDNRTKETNDTVWGKTVGGIYSYHRDVLLLVGIKSQRSCTLRVLLN